MTIKEGASGARHETTLGMTMTMTVGEHLVLKEVTEDEVETVVAEMMVGVLRETTRMILADGTILTSTATHRRHLREAVQLHEDDKTVAGVEEVIDEVVEDLMDGEDEAVEVVEAIPMDGGGEVIEVVEVIPMDGGDEVIVVIDNSITEDLGNDPVGTIQEMKRKNDQLI